MSDTTPPDGSDGTSSDPADEGVHSTRPRRTTAAASAASRARRIGGTRATPRPSTKPVDPSGDDEAAASPVTPRPAPSLRKAAAEPPASETSVGGSTSGEDAAADGGVRTPPPWLRWVPAGALSACAAAMVVIVLIAAHGVWYAVPSSSVIRDKVLAAAKVCTAATNTYSYQTLSRDEAKGLACATGKWSSQYRQAIASIVKPTATRLKASQAVQINAAGIESVSSDGRTWHVVLYGQIKVTQAKQTPRLDPFSADVTMSEVGGRWLISKINPISSTSGDQ